MDVIRGEPSMCRYHLAYIGWLARTGTFSPATGSVTATWHRGGSIVGDHPGRRHGLRRYIRR